MCVIGSTTLESKMKLVDADIHVPFTMVMVGWKSRGSLELEVGVQPLEQPLHVQEMLLIWGHLVHCYDREGPTILLSQGGQLYPSQLPEGVDGWMTQTTNGTPP